FGTLGMVPPLPNPFLQRRRGGLKHALVRFADLLPGPRHGIVTSLPQNCRIPSLGCAPMKNRSRKSAAICFVHLAIILSGLSSTIAFGADSSDILLDLFVRKGFVTEEEAKKVKTEADALRGTGTTNALPAI